MLPSTVERTQKEEVAGVGKTNNNIALLALVVIALCSAAIVFFTNLGSTPLFNPDEAYYAEPAREMLESGNYIVTYLNYVVRHTKPPLIIWIMAASYQLFGVTEFAARYFGAACGCILVVVTALFTRKYVNMRAGMIAAAILITSPLFIGVGREAITDMPLSLFIAGALMSFFHGYKANEQRWKWIACALLGLAIMTKGPVGLVLPVVVLGAYHLLRGDWKNALRYYQPLKGLVLTLAIGLPWFVIVIAKTHGDYYREFILRENFQRFTSVVDHKAPWYYHLIAIFGGLLPWSVFLPAAGAAVLNSKGRMAGAPSSAAIGTRSQTNANENDKSGSTRPSLVRITEHPTGLLQRVHSMDTTDSALLLSLCTVVIIVSFFSASVSKLIPYTVPAFPAAAVLIAAFLDKILQKQHMKPLALFFGTLSVVYGAALLIAPHLVTKIRDCPPELPQLVNCALGALCVASILAFLATWKKRLGFAIAFYSLALLGTLSIFGLQAIEKLGDYWEQPIQAYAEFIGNSKAPVVVFEIRKPSIPFYAHRRVTVTDDPNVLKRAINNAPNLYIITRTSRADLLQDLGCKQLSKMGKTMLAQHIAQSVE